MEEIRNLTLQLSLAKGFGIAKWKQMVEREHDLTKAFKLPEIKGYLNSVDGSLYAKILADQNFCCIWEEDYPQLLRETADPPIILYWKGNQKLLNQVSISIVGTRVPSDYGVQWTKKLVHNLSQKLLVVSGMAFGIDAVAHETAVQTRNCSTIAVLASSVDVPTPHNNSNLYRKILETGGLIVSATPPGSKLSPGMFAARNRIIAGMSSSTIVIEAGVGSGALITAELAQDANRIVFALPGDVDRTKSFGTNWLIKTNRAQLFQGASDIFSELGFEFASKSQNKTNQGKEIGSLGQRILDLISNGSRSTDAIIVALPKYKSDAILSELTRLILENIVLQLNNGEYRLVL